MQVPFHLMKMDVVRIMIMMMMSQVGRRAKVFFIPSFLITAYQR